jgi:hypothetical protein
MKYINIMRIIGFIFIPLVTWEITLTIIVGFYFPLIHLKGKDKKISWYNDVLVAGLRRGRNYKWEIFFASVGGIVLTDIYIFFQDFVQGQFISPLYRIMGTVLLVVFLFGKGYKIASSPPYSPPKSIKLLWRGFLNPLQKSNLQKLKNFLEKDMG